MLGIIMIIILDGRSWLFMWVWVDGRVLSAVVAVVVFIAVFAVTIMATHSGITVGPASIVVVRTAVVHSPILAAITTGTGLMIVGAWVSLLERATGKVRADWLPVNGVTSMLACVSTCGHADMCPHVTSLSAPMIPIIWTRSAFQYVSAHVDMC